MPKIRDLGVSYIPGAQPTCDDCSKCTSQTCTTTPDCAAVSCKASRKGKTYHAAFSADAVAQLKSQLRSRIG